MTQIVTLPLRLDSRANFRGHTRSRTHRKKIQEQRGLARIILGAQAKKPGLPCTIRLTRIAPRFLDPKDNLPMSMKSVRDGICDWLGVDDRTHEINWVYDQEQSDKPRTYGCVIQISEDEPAKGALFPAGTCTPGDDKFVIIATTGFDVKYIEEGS